MVREILLCFRCVFSEKKLSEMASDTDVNLLDITNNVYEKCKINPRSYNVEVKISSFNPISFRLSNNSELLLISFPLFPNSFIFFRTMRIMPAKIITVLTIIEKFAIKFYTSLTLQLSILWNYNSCFFCVYNCRCSVSINFLFGKITMKKWKLESLTISPVYLLSVC